MEPRKATIQEWIDARKKRGEIKKCIFYITAPENTDISKDEIIKRIDGILSRNHSRYRRVDTVCGAWNLNREWIETEEIDCIVEFCGVYPINWDMDDVVEFERMETDGDIVVLVDWVQEGEHIPNH